MNTDVKLFDFKKFAWGAEGHNILTTQTARGMGMPVGGATERIVKEYAADISDAHKGTGRLANIATEMKAKGGVKGKVLGGMARAGSLLGTAADVPVRHPFSPLAQARHAFPGTLDQARDIIRTGRDAAGTGLADAAMARGGQQQRLLTQALAHAGESSHVAQDVKPHTVVAGRYADQALKGQHGAGNRIGAQVAKKMPGVKPMAMSGVGHRASGLSGVASGAELDDPKNITPRDRRNAAKHGKKIRIKAVEALRNKHGVPTQQAVKMVDDLLATNPSALQEVAGKAKHRAGSYLKPVGKLLGKLRR